MPKQTRKALYKPPAQRDRLIAPKPEPVKESWWLGLDRAALNATADRRFARDTIKVTPYMPSGFLTKIGSMKASPDPVEPT